MKWVPSKYFEGLHWEAEYKHVSRRTTQRRVKRESKRELLETLEASRKKYEEDE